MAMGASGSGGGRRSNRRVRRRNALSEINVTPMVDVMLVLLIIFMVSAPLLTSGVKIQLPKTEAAALTDEGDPLTVSIDAEGKIYVSRGNDPGGDQPLTYEQMVARLKLMNNDAGKPVYVRAAGSASYDTVAKVMAKLSTSGFVKINLLTETMGKSAAGKTGGASSSSGAAAS